MLLESGSPDDQLAMNSQVTCSTQISSISLQLSSHTFISVDDWKSSSFLYICQSILLSCSWTGTLYVLFGNLLVSKFAQILSSYFSEVCLRTVLWRSLAKNCSRLLSLNYVQRLSWKYFAHVRARQNSFPFPKLKFVQCDRLLPIIIYSRIIWFRWGRGVYTLCASEFLELNILSTWLSPGAS